MQPAATPSRPMQAALDEARHALDDDDGGPFGAVVVREGRIVGRGRNRVLGAHDPTAHAEVVAIRAACRALGTHDLGGALLYATCEPCPMCLAAAWWARVSRVYYGATRGDAAGLGFDDQRIYEELARPLEARRLPLEVDGRSAAVALMRAWHARPDRRGY